MIVDDGISSAVRRRGLLVEAELRAWLKHHKRLWRFENKMGGDFGFPDCMISAHGRSAFIELKIADTIDPCMWRFWVQRNQIPQLKSLQQEGLTAFLMVGFIGSLNFGICFNTDRLTFVQKANQIANGKRQVLVSKWDYVGSLEHFGDFERWLKKVPRSVPVQHS